MFWTGEPRLMVVWVVIACWRVVDAASALPQSASNTDQLPFLFFYLCLKAAIYARIVGEDLNQKTGCLYIEITASSITHKCRLVTRFMAVV